MPTQRRILSEATSSPTMMQMMPRMITEFPFQTSPSSSMDRFGGGRHPRTQSYRGGFGVG